MSQRDEAYKMAVSRPLYSQVRDLLLDRIEGGHWKTGTCIPNELQLSTEFGVSIGTVRKAVDGLEKAGVVVRKQGRGTFLTGDLKQRLSVKLGRLRAASGQPLDLQHHLLETQVRVCSDLEAATLNCRKGSEVVQIEQILSLAGCPVGLERSVVRQQTFPSLRVELTKGQDLYSVYAQFGRIVDRTQDRVSAVSVPNHIGAVIEATSDWVLMVERLALDERSEPLEQRHGWYRPEKINYICV